MAYQNQQSNQPTQAATGNRGNGVSTFLSSMAVLLSTLALVCGGYAIYQVRSHTTKNTGCFKHKN
ncbi:MULTISPECIES: hypothetical protein [Fischerella]|uniref:hypothetical protein n=1 Tax=Fischerella TaxID=1190 RepID=UPI001F232B1C|nr:MULTISPECIES: hypothetical protein [Fischerella]